MCDLHKFNSRCWIWSHYNIQTFIHDQVLWLEINRWVDNSKDLPVVIWQIKVKSFACCLHTHKSWTNLPWLFVAFDEDLLIVLWESRWYFIQYAKQPCNCGISTFHHCQAQPVWSEAFNQAVAASNQKYTANFHLHDRQYCNLLLVLVLRGALDPILSVFSLHAATDNGDNQCCVICGMFETTLQMWN